MTCHRAAACLMAAIVACSALGFAPGARATLTAPPRGQTMPHHPYLGMWVTADGHIRQELLPNGRYDEARGTRRSAYQGRYAIHGDRIDYRDDTGFTADGVFVTHDELHHAGMVFHRRP